MKRTLLDDILQVYYTIPCDYIPHYFCSSCTCCKNREMCFMIENLINSIKNFY